jgi:tetratricopeptide (TPR) repeat protein
VIPRRRWFAAAVLTLLPAFAAGARGADSGWVRVRTPHLDVLSDAAEADARLLAVRLERFRAAATALLAAEPLEDEAPTVVLAFKDAAAFEPFRPVYAGRAQDVDGFSIGGSDSGYIALRLGTGQRDPFETAYHEYAHLLLNRMLPAQPVWVAEGLAEVLSAWEDTGAESRFGLDRPEHVQQLRREGVMGLDEILSVGWTSAAYHVGADRPRFYAQSWALARALLASDLATGSRRLRAYLETIADGTPSGPAFAAAFGRPYEVLVAEIAAAAPEASLPPIRVTTPAAEAALAAPEAVRVAPAEEGEVEFRLGDLLLHAGRVKDARAHLRRAVERDPRHARAHESLAHAAIKDSRWEEAEREIAAALALAPDDPVALLRHAQAKVRHAAARGTALDDAAEGQLAAMLERAVARAPQLADACDLLARLRPEPFAHRIRLLRAALAARPERTDLALTLTGLYVRQDDLRAARAVLLRARERARDDANRFLCDHLLGRLEVATRGTKEIEGTLVHLECGDGVLDFVVEAAAGRRRLRAPSTRGVFVYAPDGTTVEREFTCGPQHLKVAARFRPEPGARPADGTLLSLTLRPR